MGTILAIHTEQPGRCHCLAGLWGHSHSTDFIQKTSLVLPNYVSAICLFKELLHGVAYDITGVSFLIRPANIEMGIKNAQKDNLYYFYDNLWCSNIWSDRTKTDVGLRHLITIRLNAHSQTDWAIEDQGKNLNSTARPYDEWAFSPLDFTAEHLGPG